MKKVSDVFWSGLPWLMVVGAFLWLGPGMAHLEQQRDHYRDKSNAFVQCLMDNDTKFWPSDYPRPIPPMQPGSRSGDQSGRSAEAPGPVAPHGFGPVAP